MNLPKQKPPIVITVVAFPSEGGKKCKIIQPFIKIGATQTKVGTCWNINLCFEDHPLSGAVFPPSIPMLFGLHVLYRSHGLKPNAAQLRCGLFHLLLDEK